MAKGSQLTQLRSALAQAGLNRQSNPNKKRKRASVSRETDKDKKALKLQEIHKKLNPFDIKVTKLKRDIGGRKVKGAVGRPQESRQAGIEQRKKTLLKEYEQRSRSGGIIDRRFGENDPTMTPEERMLERFKKERQRSVKNAAFNLEDEDDLTHYGQSLSKMDDFEDAGLVLDEDEDELDGKIGRATVKATHFGGFNEEEEGGEGGDEPSRKRTKAEVMAEVIAKSKQHKFERQMQKQEDSETRRQLDQELNDIRGLLFTESSADAVSSGLAKDHKSEDADYDRHVQELALDKRAKPKDRTRTEEELALEAKEALEKAERKRQRRMMGEDGESSEEEGDRGRKRPRRIATGDDLEDDFEDEGEAVRDELGTGLEGNGSDKEGVDAAKRMDESEESAEEEWEPDSDEDSAGTAESEAESSRSRSPGVAKKKGKGKAVEKDMPFTFPCPETIDDFLEIIEAISENDVPTVVHRIRTLYNPSLAQDNKFKLQNLTGVLTDYILHITSPPRPSFHVLPALLSHLRTLTVSYPIESVGHFVSKLKLMQKNLSRGLSKGATSMDAKTWPGPSELAFLWIISHIWPTSDMKHPVISPARLLMGAYLGLSRVRSLQDIASGLFLCSVFLHYEDYSKRLVPEALTFLLNAILHLAPHSFKDIDALPGSFPSPDFNNPLCRPLRLSKTGAKGLDIGTPNICMLLTENNNAEQGKLNLFATALELLKRFAELCKGTDAFIELFRPAAAILDGIDISWASEPVKNKYAGTRDEVKRMLKFALQSRRPLALQVHKPIPIATFIPKFESSKSSYLRKNDPDHERAAAAKLRYQHKQERKGAIRELRKDARFMSAIKEKEQQEKDRAYSERMNKVFASIESERAEQKKMEREKAKGKRRAGRK